MIELKNVTMAYGGKTVFENLSLRLDAPGAYALLGPSGCGKTTLLHLIAGLQKPVSGSVLRDESQPVAFCFQEDRLLPWYTVRENIALVLPDALEREEALRRADMWLERVGLRGEGGSYPAQLSGGMKRRASLARALAFDAPVLLMDEPFRALDENTHQDMLRLVRACAEGKLLILVTHDEKDADGMTRIPFRP